MALTAKQQAKRNFNYGQLVDGVLYYAPYYLIVGTRMYVNASADKYLAQGWKAIVDNGVEDDWEAQEEAGFYYQSTYTEDDTTIYISWVLTPIPTDEEGGGE